MPPSTLGPRCSALAFTCDCGLRFKSTKLLAGHHRQCGEHKGNQPRESSPRTPKAKPAKTPKSDKEELRLAGGAGEMTEEDVVVCDGCGQGFASVKAFAGHCRHCEDRTPNKRKREAAKLARGGDGPPRRAAASSAAAAAAKRARMAGSRRRNAAEGESDGADDSDDDSWGTCCEGCKKDFRSPKAVKGHVRHCAQYQELGYAYPRPPMSLARSTKTSLAAAASAMNPEEFSDSENQEPKEMLGPRIPKGVPLPPSDMPFSNAWGQYEDPQPKAKPRKAALEIQVPLKLFGPPPGWKVQHSPEHDKWYFWNEETKETRWNLI